MKSLAPQGKGGAVLRWAFAGGRSLLFIVGASVCPLAGNVMAQQAEGAGSPVTLAPVTVQGVATDGTTEGTGSYTGDSSSASTRLPLSLRETPQSVSIITSQRMEDQGLTQLTDVVNWTPGLTLSGSGNAGSDSSPIYARGFQVDNYLIDGVGLNYTNYTDLAQTSDMAMFDRVEVVRGAAGLMSGVGSPGATINLIRKRPTRDFQASVKAEAGSWDYYRGEADVSTPLNASGSVRGRLVAAWQDNRSYIDRLHERKKLLYGIVEADLTDRTLATLGFSFQEQDATGHARSGLPAFYSDGTRTEWKRSDSAAARWASSDRRSYSIFGSLEHRFDNEWKVKGTLTRSGSEYDEVLGYAAGGNPDRATGAGVNLWAGRWAGEPVQDSFDLYATGPYTLFGRKHELALGATATRTREETPTYNLWWFDNWSNAVPNIYSWNGRYPTEPLNPPNGEMKLREKLTSAYMTTRLHATDSLSVILGGRITSWRSDKSTQGYGAAKNVVNRGESDKFTPYAGIVYDINDNWSAYASYTSIFKPQTYKDVEGNYLDPLVGNSYEAGIKGAFFDERLNVTAAMFMVKQDNFAVAIPGQFAPDGSGAYRAESGTRSRGFEVEAAGELAPNWQAAVSYGRTLTEDRNGDVLNTYIPQNTFKLFTTYRFPNIGRGLTVGGGVRWQSAIYSNNLGAPGRDMRQSSYALVDLMANYVINKHVTAHVNLYNVFDKKYYTTVGYSSYYGAPAFFKAGLEIRY